MSDLASARRASGIVSSAAPVVKVARRTTQLATRARLFHLGRFLSLSRSLCLGLEHNSKPRLKSNRSDARFVALAASPILFPLLILLLLLHPRPLATCCCRFSHDLSSSQRGFAYARPAGLERRWYCAIYNHIINGRLCRSPIGSLFSKLDRIELFQRRMQCCLATLCGCGKTSWPSSMNFGSDFQPAAMNYCLPPRWLALKYCFTLWTNGERAGEQAELRERERERFA